MKNIIKTITLFTLLLAASKKPQAQVLNVSIENVGSNRIQITGVATAPGFDVSPMNTWGSLNLTWRIPKSAANPPLTLTPPPDPTPEVTGESTDFTGAAPRNAFPSFGLDLTVFDLTSFGLTDDGYWYFQVTGTTQAAQDIATGVPVILYDFTLPATYTCPGCVELLTTDVPELLDMGISTTSSIYNAGMGVDGTDVLNLVQNNAPLPVHFISFNARKENDEVALSWRVTNEEHVKNYYVERSGDGINWNGIGITGAKPASQYNDYQFTDRSPLMPLNFYRIREEDMDGRKVYSAVRKVNMDAGNFIVTLYPVPVHDELIVKLQTNVNESAQLRITDALGRVVLVKKVRFMNGTNTERLPVNNLQQGTYFIEITGTRRRWTGKFIKQ